VLFSNKGTNNYISINVFIIIITIIIIFLVI